MALVLTRQTGESIVFTSKTTNQSATITVLSIFEHGVVVRVSVGEASQQREISFNTTQECFNGTLIFNKSDRGQLRMVMALPEDIKIMRKELLK